ncbi:hypothetical protein B0H34DRAFT_17645 [Crassisporium funariophilum]|nr:hypothetical protein B0H34DRAFT_17645 [Crassisporium funariophilum]
MSALQRAFPYLVAATTGVISGVYIFKPMVTKEAQDLSEVPSQTNVVTFGEPPKRQNVANEKDAK